MVDAGEIFSPYYADAVVNYVLETHRGDEDEDEGLETLRVYEIGGGTGTFATGFLDAGVRRRAPKVYEKMRYTSIDISKTLVDAQSARVRAGGHGKGVHTAVVGDATTVEAWGATKTRRVSIALEVLDNLPHDRVWRSDAR